VIREDLTGAAHLTRSESPNETEFRFEFREQGERRRIFTVVMNAEQFAGAFTARVSDARMELRERTATAVKSRLLRDAAEHARKVLGWINESNPDGDPADHKTLQDAIEKLDAALEAR
jgi:hypothetical protein